MKSSLFRWLIFPGVVIGSTVFFFDCTKDVGVMPPPVPPPPGICDTITYSEDVKPIIDTKCLSCHNSTLATKGWNFDTYGQLKKASDEGILRDVLLGQNGKPVMPSGTSGLPKAEKDIIFCWIENGEKP